MKYYSIIIEVVTDEDPENVVKEALEADSRVKEVIVDSIVKIDDYEEKA